MGDRGDRGDRFLPGDEKRSAAGPDSGHHSGSFDQPDEHQAWKYGHALRRSGCWQVSLKCHSVNTKYST